MRLRTQIVKSENTQNIRTQMWELYRKYYHTEEAAFYQRFNTNQYYALYRCEGQLVGFTGLREKEIFNASGTALCVYIGQTIIDTRFRKYSLIPRSCLYIVLKNFLANPFRPIYLWCDSLTYKPYIAFAKATTYTYPTRKKETPDHVQQLIHKLGRIYYGNQYNPARGTVKKEMNVVNDSSSIITRQDLQQADIAFYASSNPDYRKGHGLITITKASVGNFIHCALRCLKKQLRFKPYRQNTARAIPEVMA